ncbi:MAG: hypothetical protein JF606_05560 [Burkholderiales bacterium]|nr:hypothetical protein [Burkholderiales bacterium]
MARREVLYEYTKRLGRLGEDVVEHGWHDPHAGIHETGVPAAGAESDVERIQHRGAAPASRDEAPSKAHLLRPGADTLGNIGAGIGVHL